MFFCEIIKGNQLKNILIIAFRFPPSAVSGTFRSLGFVRHLAKSGWKQQVLTINQNLNESPDNTLLTKLPPDINIVRTGVIDIFRHVDRMKTLLKKTTPTPNHSSAPETTASENTTKKPSFKETITYFLKTPDNQLGWFFPALAGFFRLSKPAIVYSSAPPFTGHLIATVFKKIWRVPMVCDFRDPWLDNPFRVPRPGRVEKWDQWLERWVVRNADIIIANTGPMAEAIKNRHPEAQNRVHVITNGYDPEDFADITPLRDSDPDKFLLLHAGSLYGQRDPRHFLEGVQMLVKDKNCTQLKIQLIGPAESYGGLTLAEHINALQLEEYVELISSVPHQEALQRMRGADMLLIFSQGTNLQVPAKIYEYMGLGKHIFAINEPDSATAHIMKGLGKQHVAVENCPTQIAEGLEKTYKLWHSNQNANETVDDGSQPFLRKTLTYQLEVLMLSALEKKAQ